MIAKGWMAFSSFANRLPSADITFSWFASVYSSFLVLLAEAFGKKSVLILGGVDVAADKALNYGIWNSWWKSKIVRYGITHASAVLAVDEFLKSEAIRLAAYDGRNITVVPTGYDWTYWLPSQGKENVVLSVASCPDMTRAKLKGIDVLMSVARKSPDIRFQIIGIHSCNFLAGPPEQC